MKGLTGWRGQKVLCGGRGGRARPWSVGGVVRGQCAGKWTECGWDDMAVGFCLTLCDPSKLLTSLSLKFASNLKRG